MMVLAMPLCALPVKQDMLYWFTSVAQYSYDATRVSKYGMRNIVLTLTGISSGLVAFNVIYSSSLDITPLASRLYFCVTVRSLSIRAFKPLSV